MLKLTSLHSPLRIALFGATGGIGKAVTEHLAGVNDIETLYLFGRAEPHKRPPNSQFMQVDITYEDQIKRAAHHVKKDGPLDIVLVLTGLLHGENIAPEKRARDMNMPDFQHSFAVNCFGPALIGKHFLPLMHRNRKTVFAALSARVGSISDNRLGGWYAYRASKAALNMVLKTLSIEFARKYPELVVLGLHPGTVDTPLSEPFQSGVPDGKLFSPNRCAAQLLAVINEATPNDSGSLIAWDGQKIPF